MNPEGMIEVDKTREPISIVLIGNTGVGKSTIGGAILCTTGAFDKRTISEAKQKGSDSWISSLMDILEDEKARGKTIEVGRAQFMTLTKKYTIFDAPGRKNYVPNMIMGATLADVAGLVVSAKNKEFEADFEKDGQTREHIQLAKSLGIQKFVVIINKMDENNWSYDRFNSIKS